MVFEPLFRPVLLVFFRIDIKSEYGGSMFLLGDRWDTS